MSSFLYIPLYNSILTLITDRRTINPAWIYKLFYFIFLFFYCHTFAYYCNCRIYPFLFGYLDFSVQRYKLVEKDIVFLPLKADKHTAHLMMSGYRRPWTSAMPGTEPTRCLPYLFYLRWTRPDVTWPRVSVTENDIENDASFQPDIHKTLVFSIIIFIRKHIILFTVKAQHLRRVIISKLLQ